MEIIEEAARVTAYDKDPSMPVAKYQRSIADLRILVDRLERSLGFTESGKPEEESGGSEGEPGGGDLPKSA